MKQSEWKSQIDETTRLFTESFGGLNSRELNWKPHPKSWSIGQNIHHLIVINQSYFPIIETIRKGNYQVPFVGKVGFLVRFFGQFLLKTVAADRKQKVKTFRIWEPSESMIDADIVALFNVHQESLKQVIEDAQDLVDQGMVISSPANKNIVYRLDKAFDIIVTHELRHYAQAKEVLQAMNEAGTSK